MAESKQSDKHPHKLRNRWLYIGSLVILVIVVVTFIGAPVATSTVGSQRLVFGRYDGEDIEYQPRNFFARQYQVIAQSLRDQGDGVNLELQLRLAWREAFNRTVLHVAILRQIGRSDARVTEARVDELIAQDPRFLVNGRFDADEYRSVSNQELFSLRTFHRESELFNQFIEDVLGSVPSTDTEREFVASMSGPQRSFQIVRFPFADFPDEEVISFGKENPELFSLLNLVVISLAEQDEAEQIRERVITGEPVADLARTYSRDFYADQGGEIGAAWSHEIGRELVDEADLTPLLDLTEGSTSSVVETTSGWSFYYALEDPVSYEDRATPEPDEELLAEVRSYLDIYEQGRIQDFTRVAADSFIQRTNESDFETAVEEFDRETVDTGFFPINYGNLQLFQSVRAPGFDDFNDAAFRDDFLLAAFSLNEDELSEPIVLRSSVIVMRLIEEREAPDTEVSFVSDFYDTIVQRFTADDIETAYVIQDRLDDRFAESFNRYVVGTGN